MTLYISRSFLIMHNQKMTLVRAQTHRFMQPTNKFFLVMNKVLAHPTLQDFWRQAPYFNNEHLRFSKTHPQPILFMPHNGAVHSMAVLTLRLCPNAEYPTSFEF